MVDCLIYKITNKVNGKIYIGQTWQTLKNRWDSGHGYRNCVKLERAIEKYGSGKFEHTLLTITHTQEIADYWETYFISKYKSSNRNIGYNIRLGGSRGKFSQATKDKMSAAKLGKPGYWTGKKRSDMSVKMKNNKNGIGKSGPRNKNWKLIDGKRIYTDGGS